MGSPGPPTRITTIKVDDVDGNFHLFKRKKTKTWVNAMMFYQAWKNIRDNNLAAGSDWVVKVDADAVFLPARLLRTVEGYKSRQEVSTLRIVRKSCSVSSATSRWYLRTVSLASSPTSRHARQRLIGRGKTPIGSMVHGERISSCRSAWTRLACRRYRTSLSLTMVLARLTGQRPYRKSRI